MARRVPGSSTTSGASSGSLSASDPASASAALLEPFSFSSFSFARRAASRSDCPCARSTVSFCEPSAWSIEVRAGTGGPDDLPSAAFSQTSGS